MVQEKTLEWIGGIQRTSGRQRKNGGLVLLPAEIPCNILEIPVVYGKSIEQGAQSVVAEKDRR